ncbi:MAG: DUF885 domain-containing protein [Solobacterium sp.]|nr:DUF885 domain-containing protein [Solobacterium sp.]
MKLFKRIITLAAAAVLMMPATPVFADSDSEFEEFLMDEFVELMESDFMTLHFALKDYEKYGIEKPERIIGSADWDGYESDAADLQETLDTLLSFDRASLNAEHQHDYDALKFYVENMIKMNEYKYFDICFYPGNAITSNLLTNFTEYVFYRKEDIDDYLDVLKSTPAFLGQVMDITRKQAAEGYFINDSSLDKVKEDIAKFTEKKEDNQLIVIFENNVDAFEGISDADREEYKAVNRDIVMNEFIPAYDRVAEELEALRGSRTADPAVCDLPDGKEYYAAYAKYKGSTDASVQEMLDICTDYIKSGIYELYAVYDAADEEIKMSDPSEVLTYLQNHLEEYPEGPEVTFRASYLDPSVANDSIVAYYMEPPVDDLKDNVIKINGDNVGDTVDLYTTLAHEGFPGHLYQITWYLNTQPSLIRTQLSTLGYTEGWAMYAESNALKDSGIGEDIAKFYALNIGISYVLDAAVDLGVNGLGWTVDDVRKYLKGNSLNEEIAPELYDFVTDNPGQILPYGVGLAQFARLREDAEAELGDKFDVVEFNEVLLTYGDRTFNAVEQDLKDYYKYGEADPEKPADPEKTDEPDTPAPAPGRKGISIPLVIAGGVLAVLLIIFLVARNSRKRF